MTERSFARDRGQWGIRQKRPCRAEGMWTMRSKMRPSTVRASGFRIALIAAMLSALSAQVGAPNGTTVQGANLNGWGLQGSSYQG
jgi:hypothetical protein